MRSLKESILDRLDESILGSNDAGIVGVVKGLLQTHPGLGKKRADHLNKLNDLWKKLGLDEGGYFWTFVSDVYFLKQNPDTNKPKAYISAGPGTYLYLASNADKDNQLDYKTRTDIIKTLKLKTAAEYTYWDCYKL